MSNRVERDSAYKVAKMKAFTSRILSNRVGWWWIVSNIVEF